MDFPISGTHINPVELMGAGFVIGVLGGFFGVGGSFLAGPALFAFGVPMNFVVGTDLAHIVGKSIVAARKHSKLGNIDFKLGLLMVAGTIPGVEAGAQCIQYLKRHADVDRTVALAFITVLIAISAFVAWESLRTLQLGRRRSFRRANSVGSGNSAKGDVSAFAGVARRIHLLQLPPMVNLPKSGIQQVSLWAVLAVAFVGGVFSGFLGGGAGYIRMPALVYLLGVPTHLAVGTDLFEVIISGGYGTFTHALKGNVDILIALVMHTGAAIGAQLGASLTAYFHGPRIRLAFVPLPLAGAALVIYTLVSGHHLG
ncbi:MAG TPA: sulfite exporter TauE/SafE family protein [Candidatus Acidoferrales bacterium]|nr:sulfite exporter TauE/SafE family protein [Candidatus Acidoferrales bacterium]